MLGTGVIFGGQWQSLLPRLQISTCDHVGARLGCEGIQGGMVKGVPGARERARLTERRSDGDSRRKLKQEDSEKGGTGWDLDFKYVLDGHKRRSDSHSCPVRL